MKSFYEIQGRVRDGSVQDEFMMPLLVKQFHVKRLSSPPAGARRRAPDRRTDPATNYASKIKHLLGRTMVTTGFAILLVPDPIPVIDEVVGAVLVYGGAYVMSSAD
jgi:hypothetical protein